MHFAGLATTLLKDEESARYSHILACNFASYAPDVSLGPNLLNMLRFIIQLN